MEKNDSILIQKCLLEYEDQKLNALIFLPALNKELKPTFALFTHGYTSHKGSLLTWASRLVEEGISCVIFDLPGHYLGTFSEVQSFDHFKAHTPELFAKAYNALLYAFKERFPLNTHDVESDKLNLILGGHSLGALIAAKAACLKEFSPIEKLHVFAVGLGLPAEGSTHIFQTPFYKSTLNLRGQLVSKELAPEKIFPWIREEKESLCLNGRKIHFITGGDDLVVGTNGTERLIEVLKSKGDQPTFLKPTRLPHHQPEAAASFIKKSFKEFGYL